MGKIIKNSVEYTAAGTISSGVSEDRVNLLISNALDGLLKQVHMGTIDYTIAAHSCEDIDIPYEDKIPDGYRVIGITDIDFGYGTDVYVNIKRVHMKMTSEKACVTLGNNTSSTITAKMYVTVLCAKETLF